MHPNALEVGDYEIDVIVQGFPGKSVCHGGLGWSSVILVKGHGRLALIDGGTFGMRRTILERLKARGLKPADVTDVLLTHSHYDHAVNWVLFKHARIVIGAAELDWSLTVPWGETPVAELYMKELATWPTLHRAADGEEVFPGITAHVLGGHTPGHLVFALKGRDGDVLFTGDAAKNRVELLTRTADATYDQAMTARTIDAIWALWTRRPGTILVPGHDLPMQLHNGRPVFLGKREAAIAAWFGDDLETTTLLRLVA